MIEIAMVFDRFVTVVLLLFPLIINKTQKQPDTKQNKMYQKRRNHRMKTSASPMKNSTKAYESSVSIILIDKCDKCTQQLQKNNLKVAKQILSSIEKDYTLLQQSQNDYARITSLVCNTKAAYYRKNGQNQEALRCLDDAILVEKLGNVDRIDMARTLLNKSVIMGQMARDDKNMYSHENAIALAKEALEIIKNRPEGKQFVHKDQYKLGQIIIISFHNIATELVCLKNEQQGYNLYKKAHDLALRVLGPRHNLTSHLKNILQKYKDEKNERRKIHTEQMSPQSKINNSNTMTASHVTKSLKKTNFIAENRKFKNFFRIYGYSKDNVAADQTADQLDMKDLSKIKKMYTPHKTNSYFPDIKRRSINDIINEGRQLASKRPNVVSMSDRQKQRSIVNTLKNSKQNSRNSSSKKIQTLKTQQIYLPPTENTQQLQQLLNTKLDRKSQMQAQQKQIKKQEGGCQLI